MGLSYDARHDMRRLELDMALYPREAMEATARAFNRTATTVRAEGSRILSREYPGLKIASIKAKIKQQRATRALLRASLAFSPKRFRLFGNFTERQTRRGVALRRAPWRLEALDGDVIPPQALSHAFIQRARTGVANVWLRVGRKRYPITAVVAASLATAFVERRIGDELMRIGRARFAVVLDQEAKFSLRQRARRELRGTL